MNECVMGKLEKMKSFLHTFQTNDLNNKKSFKKYILTEGKQVWLESKQNHCLFEARLLLIVKWGKM